MPFEPSIDPPVGWASKGSGLTYTQLRLIGQVVSHWAILDIALQQMLFMLAQSPEFLGQALTEDLGPDHRLKAFKRLCRHWRKFLNQESGNEDVIGLVENAQECATWITKNKDQRNKVAHWWWSRVTDDKMFCYKYTMKPHASEVGQEGGNFASMPNSELEAFANSISEMATRMLALSRLLQAKLPAWPYRRPALDSDH